VTSSFAGILIMSGCRQQSSLRQSNRPR